ncbi:ARPP-1 family domain-containing protein [Thermodesulfobacteriota bacterium]
MVGNIQEYLRSIKVGAKQSHKNVTLYCLPAAEEADVDFVTLDEALEKEFLFVTEVDESGSVPELRVTNRSNRKVLMLDGEELVGAKQNRVLNVTVLIAAESETVIPVSCVEQGRWSYRSREFGTASRTMSPDLRRKKSRSVTHNLRASGSFASAQGMVWDEIDAKFERMAASPSPTHAMSDLYEELRERSDGYLKAFNCVDNQVGTVVFIDGEVVGIELLGKFETFKKNHPKLVRSYVMDALETAASDRKPKTKPSKSRVSNILEATGQSTVEARKSVALGNDVRVESEVVVGSGLEYEGQVLQLTIFPNHQPDEPGGTGRAIRRASERRRSKRRS